MYSRLKDELCSPISDPKYLSKTVFGAVLHGLVVTAPILLGYKLQLIRDTAAGQTQDLPAFKNLGRLWLQGFKMFSVLLVLFVLSVGTVMGIAMMISLALLEAGLHVDPYAAGQISGALGMAIPFLFLWYLLPALTLSYAKTNRLSSLIDLKQALGYIRSAPSTYNRFSLLSMLGLSALGFSAGLLLGEWSSQIVYMLGATWILFVQGRFLGEYHRRYLV